MSKTHPALMKTLTSTTIYLTNVNERFIIRGVLVLLICQNGQGKQKVKKAYRGAPGTIHTENKLSTIQY